MLNWMGIALGITLLADNLGGLTLAQVGEQLVRDLPGYVNREYARMRVPGHLVLVGQPRTDGTSDAQAISVLTLERFRYEGRLVPVLIERRIAIAQSAGYWRLVEVRSTLRPLDEYADSKLGPYLSDYPTSTTVPPSIAGLEPYITTGGAFNRAITRWLSDVQLADESL